MTPPKQAARPAPSTDRLPPSDPAAERGVLGCVLLDWRMCLDEAVEHLPSKDAFYDTPCAIIWDAILEQHKKKKPADIITIHNRLNTAQTLEHIGGRAFLEQLQDNTPTAANLGYYIEIVEEKWTQRRLLAVGTEMASSAQDWRGDTSELLDKAEREVMAIRNGKPTDTRSLGVVVDAVIANVESIMAHKGIKGALSTGYPRLDRQLTSGLCGPKVVVIAARPSEGKTTLAMNIVENVAITNNIPVGVFSLEMDAEELILRTICSKAQVNFSDIINDTMHPEGPEAMASWSNLIRKAPIHIDDTPGLTANQIKARARRMVQKHKIKLVVVDYLQLMSGTKRSKENRQAEVADISKEMKSLAKELKIPVILACQLNREMDKDKGRRPQLSDLRESGAIEQDADIVLMIWRKAEKKKSDDDKEEEQEPDEVPVNIVIAKQRSGPRNRLVPLIFQRQFTRFTNPPQPKIAESDMPPML